MSALLESVSAQEKEHHFYFEAFRADQIHELIPNSVASAPVMTPAVDERVRALEAALAEKEKALAQEREHAAALTKRVDELEALSGLTVQQDPGERDVARGRRGVFGS